MKFSSLLKSAAALALVASTASAATTLRIQTHYAADHPSGKLAQQFADDVEVMSNGSIDIEMCCCNNGNIRCCSKRHPRL
jgi:TRAP-type C4-dicarboxylate transport system substrate-binding protein